jgi:hypothetical protein
VFSSFAFGFIYHAYPLMVGRDWFSRSLAAFHFWTTEIGVVLGTVFLLATGTAQAAGAPPDGLDVVVVLRVLTGLSFAAIALAQYAFAYNTFRTSRAGPFVHVMSASAAVGSAR